MENWRKVEGITANYEVSDAGKVRAEGRQPRKLGKHGQGYLLVTIKVNNKCKSFLVHRLVAQAFLPNPGNKEFVNHIDGNKANNTLSNLEWATRGENESHAIFTGLKSSKGATNTQAKLTEADVVKIRAMADTGFRGDVLGSYFGVTRATIGRVVQGKIWGHV